MPALAVRLRTTALILAAIACPAGRAMASDDLRKLDACLAASDAAAKQVVACIDFLKCGADARCHKREYDAWRARVDALVRSVGKSEPTLAAPLKAAQSEWQRSLATLCPLFDHRDPGLGLSGDFCRARETAMRALDLQQLDYALGEH